MKHSGRNRFERFFNSVVGVLAATILLVFFTTSTAASAKTTTWKWTAENPKPDWWTWGDEYSKEKPVSGGIYRTAAQRYIGLMNPNHWPVNDWVAMTYIYETLIWTDGTFQPNVNWLAESWRFTGPTSAVMKLRQGVTFHDGSDFNAESFKYQIDWIKDKKNGAWTRAWIAPLKSVSVVDKYTVSFEFTKQWGAFSGIMANIPGYAISKKALEADVALIEMGKTRKKLTAIRKKIGKLEAKAGKQSGKKAKSTLKKATKERKKRTVLEKDLARYEKLAEGAIPLDKHAVGTGKFMVEDGRPGNYLKLKRNPNWWFGRSVGKPEMPYFDGVQINVIPDQSVQLANFRAGKLDSIAIARAQYNLLKRDPRAQIYTYVGNHWMGYAFNHAEGPCADIRVRKAISHAIDRRALIAGTQFGLAVPATGGYPSVHWAHNPNLKPVEYNPELSKKLLAEAGYANGLIVKGNVSNLGEYMTIASAVKNMLNKVGINWQYDTLDPVASDDRLKNREYDLRQHGWSWIYDPDMMATGYYHPDGSFNHGRSNNTKVISLIEKARGALDPKERQKMYWRIEEHLYENYEDVWLWWPKDLSVFSKNVMGWNQKHYLAGRQGQWFSHSRWFKNGRR